MFFLCWVNPRCFLSAFTTLGPSGIKLPFIHIWVALFQSNLFDVNYHQLRFWLCCWF